LKKTDDSTTKSCRRRCGGLVDQERAISDPISRKLQLSAKVQYGAVEEVKMFEEDGAPGGCDEDGRLLAREKVKAQISTDRDNSVI
jgi:hypothetical protein